MRWAERALGQPTVMSAARGVAAAAAKSLRGRARALRPMREAGVEGVKWIPSTKASVFRTRSRFLENGERTAQS
jgi:hypothetical protein